jgi:hypothetical protein
MARFSCPADLTDLFPPGSLARAERHEQGVFLRQVDPAGPPGHPDAGPPGHPDAGPPGHPDAGPGQQGKRP